MATKLRPTFCACGIEFNILWLLWHKFHSGVQIKRVKNNRGMMALSLKSVLQIIVCAAILQLFIPDNKPAEVYLWSGFHVNIESVVKPLHKETPY